MEVKHFFESATNTMTYVVYDKKTLDAVIIDPVLDFDLSSATISSKSATEVIDFIKDNKLNLQCILETHAHADHLSSSQYIKDVFPNVRIGINENIKIVQETFKGIFNHKDLNIDGSQFDFLLTEDKILEVGSIKIKTIFTPGHTPACSSILIDNNLFVGDALFMPDSGTGRCDFPRGSAKDLYNSIYRKIYALPDETNIYTGHDYMPKGRELQFKSTVKEQKENNIYLNKKTTEDEFIKFREERDATLNFPKLLYPSIQFNINAGTLPVAEGNGKSYFKLPINISTDY